MSGDRVLLHNESWGNKFFHIGRKKYFSSFKKIFGFKWFVRVFFQVDEDVIARVFERTRELFDLPLEEKERIMDSDLNRGYTRIRV